MNPIFILLTIVGLSLFEVITSVDNAIINAEVLHGMSKKARRFFLVWGFLFAVFVVRGLLPFVIVWIANPDLGPWNVITATLSGDPGIQQAIEASSPLLLLGGGVFLIFLFFHWLFLEEKNFGLFGERFFQAQGAWFFAIVSVLLAFIVWHALKIESLMGFAAVVGSTAFFIIHGFRTFAEEQEQKLIKGTGKLSDMSKIAYLEVLDATFSIDGVVGAFAFTISIPLILLGNGLGAFVLRHLTVSNIERIKRYKYIKNGAMYSIFFLGIIMLANSFGYHFPEWISPIITFATVGFFFWKSKVSMETLEDAVQSKTR